MFTNIINEFIHKIPKALFKSYSYRNNQKRVFKKEYSIFDNVYMSDISNLSNNNMLRAYQFLLFLTCFYCYLPAKIYILNLQYYTFVIDNRLMNYKITYYI